MNESETLTKMEYEFLTTIEKQNSLIEKLKLALEAEKKSLESFKAETAGAENDSIALKTDIEILKKELGEEIAEAQTYIVEVEKLNDTHKILNEGLKQLNESHEKTIAEMKKNILPAAEILFWQAAKADVVLQKIAAQKKFLLSIDELSMAEFPIGLFEKDSSGIETTNYRLEKVNDQQYKLTRK